MNISALQKKILIISSVVFLAFLAFWLFIYSPGKNRIAKIKSELQNVQGQLRQTQEIIGGTENTGQNMQLLTERSQKLKNKFPEKEEESLRALSQLARKLNIEIISIKPRAKAAFLDEDNKKTEIEGKRCQCVFVSMEMSCFYKDLVKYIQALKEALPAFISVERLQIKKTGAVEPKLNIKLDINLYLLS